MPDKKGSEIPSFIGSQSALKHSLSHFFFLTRLHLILFNSPQQDRSLEDMNGLLGQGAWALALKMAQSKGCELQEEAARCLDNWGLGVLVLHKAVLVVHREGMKCELYKATRH